MLAEITKEEALWLIEEFAPKRSYGIRNNTIGMFLRAYNLMKGGEHVIKCTSCEARTIASIANSMYGQYEADIKKIAYPE